jgi:hypothetical protein
VTEGCTVLVTGPVAADVERVALEIDGRLRARGVPTELIDPRTPGVDALSGEGALLFAAAALTRHGIFTIVALPIHARAARDRARDTLGRLIEVFVRSEGSVAEGYEHPLRAEVEVILPNHKAGTGADRALRALELLDLLEPVEGGAYSEEEEREVIKRLKAFGYL